MKRVVAAAAVVAALVGSLAGCGGGGGSTDAGGSGASAGPVKLTFWHGYTEADGKVLDKLVTDFNASQRDVEITTATKPWATLLDTVLPALSAKKGPQILALPPENIPTYASKGALEPLDDWYSSAGSKAELNEQAVATGEADGKKYGAPLSFTPLTMFYNKAMFAKAGVAVPTTWDEWVAAAQKLTIDANGDGTPEQYGLALQDNATVGNGVWPSLFASGGGAIVDSSGKAALDSPANISTLSFWADAVTKDKISPTGLSGANADKLFTSGKVAMTFGGPWLATASQASGIDYGIAPLPAGPAGTKASALAVDLTVTAQATPAEKAAVEKFLTWFYQPQNMVTWSLGSGWPPLTTDVTASQVAENPVVAALTEQSKDGIALLPGVKSPATVLTDVDAATQQALAGGDVTSLLKEANTKVSEDLQK